mgnify:CR=1 FL=1
MTRRRLRGTALVLIAGLITGWLLALQPELAERSAAVQEAGRLQAQLAADRASAAALDTWHDRVAGLEERIRTHPMRLPVGPDLPALLGRVADLAVASGTQLLAVEPGAVARRAHYQARPVSLRLAGGWQGLVTLLTRLARGSRALTLSELIINRRDGEAAGPRLEMTLSLTGHWQRGDAGAGEQASAPTGWLADSPATTPQWPALHARNPMRPPAGAVSHRTDGSGYVGRIRIGQRVWALRREADGSVHRRRIQPQEGEE